MVRLAFVIALALGLAAPAMPASAQRRDRDERGRHDDRGRRDRDRGHGPHDRGRDRLNVESMVPQAGPVGSTVTLRGNFPHDARVTFAGRDVPVSRGPGSLRFTVPNAPPGVHAVVVHAGREQANAGQFRVGPAGPVVVAPPPAPTPPVAPPPPRVVVRPPPRFARFQAAPVVTGYAPRRGPAGTTVTIRGQRFTPNMSVVLGDRTVPARVTPTTITFTVPPNASTGLLRLRRPRSPDLVVGSFRVGMSRRDQARAAALAERLRREAEAAWRARQAQLAATREARLEALRRREEELARSREQRRLEQLARLREQ
ncbi:MAG TPA: IPT/TIG domain-containing protein, partial [Sandaracinaceae bacterium]